MRWLTAFLDRPAERHDAAVAFWSELTGSMPSERRGADGEFASLVPPDGDAHLRVQRVGDGVGGSHLDVHVDDPHALARRAVALGAREVARSDAFAALRSPAGLPWCAVGAGGERRPAAPRTVPGTAASYAVDQLCIDVPSTAFDGEVRFWSDLTGWPVRPSSAYDEFTFLVAPEGLPLRILLQRRHDDDGDARAHLDLSSSDRDLVVAHAVRLGAVQGDRHAHWTVLHDPAGLPFCVTVNPPAVASGG